MTRKNLISLIVLDVIVMIMAVGLMAYRYQAFSGLSLSTLSKTAANDAAKAASEPAPAPVQPTAGSASAVPETAAVEKPAANTDVEARNISFTYKNSKAKRVEIIGDFTNWIPMKMTRGAANTWKINVTIAPGDYAYNYVVNGKPRRDPNNPKVCNAGRGFPNSFLKVKPLSNDNKKTE